MVVARLAGDLAGDEPARRLEIEHGDLGLEQRALDPLPAAGALALDDGEENAHRREDARSAVGHRDADAHGALPGQAGDRHEAAHALGDLVEARPVAIGTALPEAGTLA